MDSVQKDRSRLQEECGQLERQLSEAHQKIADLEIALESSAQSTQTGVDSLHVPQSPMQLDIPIENGLFVSPTRTINSLSIDLHESGSRSPMPNESSPSSPHQRARINSTSSTSNQYGNSNNDAGSPRVTIRELQSELKKTQEAVIKSLHNSHNTGTKLLMFVILYLQFDVYKRNAEGEKLALESEIIELRSQLQDLQSAVNDANKDHPVQGSNTDSNSIVKRARSENGLTQEDNKSDSMNQKMSINKINNSNNANSSWSSSLYFLGYLFPWSAGSTSSTPITTSIQHV